MAEDIDVDAYFARIGYKGEPAPTLATLRSLHARHPEVIPFENLTPWLGRPVSLDIDSLQRKLIRDHRGGYCFEQNLLFSRVLKAIGFRVTGLAARVLWNQPETAITARTHMLLLVDIQGQPYVADVGFGVQTLTAPLRLVPEVEQDTLHEPFRLVRAGNEGFMMQSRSGSTWRTLYRFDLQEQFEVDYEVTNYYLSAHPASHFRTSLIAARPAAGRRYTLLNNKFVVHHLNAATEQRILATPAELREVLQTAFKLRLPEDHELEVALARVIAKAS
jgi:N-hydroxyarylamine O-acetyltransferase